MANFFELAASDPTMITQVVNAMRESAAEAGITFAEANEYVELALENPELKANLQTRLDQLAAQSGLVLITDAVGMAYEASAILKFKGHKINPAQNPLGMETVDMFLGAVVLYAPNLYDSVEGILSGGSADGGGVDS
jgi:hypothetical protein